MIKQIRIIGLVFIIISVTYVASAAFTEDTLNEKPIRFIPKTVFPGKESYQETFKYIYGVWQGWAQGRNWEEMETGMPIDRIVMDDVPASIKDQVGNVVRSLEKVRFFYVDDKRPYFGNLNDVPAGKEYVWWGFALCVSEWMQYTFASLIDSQSINIVETHADLNLGRALNAFDRDNLFIPHKHLGNVNNVNQVSWEEIEVKYVQGDTFSQRLQEQIIENASRTLVEAKTYYDGQFVSLLQNQDNHWIFVIGDDFEAVAEACMEIEDSKNCDT